MTSTVQEISSTQDLTTFSITQQKILKHLAKEGPSSRRYLVKKLGIPRTTLYDNLLKLLKKNRVEKFSRNNGNRGRPLTYWKLKK